MILITNVIINVILFISLYYVVFWMLVLLEEPKKNAKVVYKEWPEVSIIIPMYNEEENIKETIQTTCKLDYPSDKLKIYVVDDGSKDNSLKIAKNTANEEMKKNPQLKITILHQENKGKYAAINNALERIDTPFFATLDADSYPEKDALKNLLQEFTTQKVGAVSPILKVKNPKKAIEKIQWFEYSINHFYKSVLTRKNAIHVTPGPLPVFRTKLVKELGGFREGHKTEDMDIAMRIQEKNYEIKQCDEAVVYTKTPNNLKSLAKQRIRWGVGGLRNLKDYSHMLFNKEYGDFGLFQLPMVLFSGIFVVITILLSVFNLRKPIKTYFLLFKTYDFNFKEYIIDSLTNFNKEFFFLNLNVKAISISIIFLSISIFLLYNGLKIFNERLEKKGIALFSYFFIYFFFLGYVWILVLRDMVFRREVKWK
ncbi:MAG: poly-beta,6-N-acetyl-D-glucosamine synthase [Candidatus Woesearchaeota archaeon]|nr:poly-beta,6-N-acetyl-D-glucosamine synthase [Candidatus Woesearchaeota archaeon]